MSEPPVRLPEPAPHLDNPPPSHPPIPPKVTVGEVVETVRSLLPSGQPSRRISYFISIWCAVALSWCFWIIPPIVRYWIADRAGDITIRMAEQYKENVRQNVLQVSQGRLTGKALDRVILQIFRISCRNFMDLITMTRSSSRALLASVTITEGDWSRIDNAIAQGRGVIFVTAHVGCFDFIGHLFRARGYKLTIVTGRTTSRFVFDGVTHLRGLHGNNLVESSSSGVRSMIKALRRGECVVILNDRDFQLNGKSIEFFGKRTTLPPGAVRIARETGAVLVPIFARRRRRGHELRILEPFMITPTANAEADLEAGMALLASILEQGIGPNLDQWAMFQPVWPEPKATPAP